MHLFRCALLGMTIMFLVIACGPVTYMQTRTAYKPYSDSDSRQEKDGVIAELKHTTNFPESFYATVQACDQYGRLLIDSNRNPVLERVSFARPGQFWQNMALTNQTDHVIRLNTVVIRVFDPAGNQLEPLSKDDLAARLLGDRPCSSSQQAANQFRANKVFDRNMEIVPGTTTTFWVAFQPPALDMPGVWKYAIYDVPVQVDQAGRTIRAARFEMRVVATKFIDTYTRDSPFAQPRLVGTKEVAQ
jgi:hypothetical protein